MKRKALTMAAFFAFLTGSALLAGGCSHDNTQDGAKGEHPSGSEHPSEHPTGAEHPSG